MKKELYYKSVYFDLPYLIFVKDGFKDKSLEDWAKAYQEGKKELPYSQYAPRQNEPGFISIGGGSPVYLPPNDLAPAYVVNLGNNILVGIQFLRRINQNNTVKLCGEVIGDRVGRASFSSVRVNFDLRIFNPEMYWDMQYFVNLSIEAVNKFIEHYRVIADRFYVGPITPETIQSFLIINSFKDGTSSNQTYGVSSGLLRGLGGSIGDEEDKQLRDVLLEDKKPPIIDTLKLEVLDKLDLREWRLAVIEAAVLFETWLNFFLREKYKIHGLTDKQIEKNFYRKDKNKTPLSVYAIAKDLIKDAAGFDFSNTKEFYEWCIKTKDLRNDIVHGKKYNITIKEAHECFNTVLSAIRIIETKTK